MQQPQPGTPVVVNFTGWASRAAWLLARFPNRAAAPGHAVQVAPDGWGLVGFLRGTADEFEAWLPPDRVTAR
jgi:hypothetical protein